jgi:hypothetical protein
MFSLELIHQILQKLFHRILILILLNLSTKYGMKKYVVFSRVKFTKIPSCADYDRDEILKKAGIEVGVKLEKKRAIKTLKKKGKEQDGRKLKKIHQVNTWMEDEIDLTTDPAGILQNFTSNAP